MVKNGKPEQTGEEQNGLTAPTITLPKGGGAIKGMGEKFAANPVTGTGSMSIPIATSPGRSGFGPQLSITYDSGSGNGPFALGWSLSLPSITRKTDKGLPKYQDELESDVFILSGAEDLVPVLIEIGGTWRRQIIPLRSVGGKTYSIQNYRPRLEGLFARIERWVNQDNPEDTFWRSISKDNITTWYGKSDESRIVDPSDPARIFSWLICESHDDKGNVISYYFAKENSDGIDFSQVHEKNRTPQTRQANRYLKSIKYGNANPYYHRLSANDDWPALPEDDKWLFEVVFDYGDHDENNPLPFEPGKQWPVRNDPFSSYRAGFEVRSYRICQRVLMFHHLPGEEGVGINCLVRSTDFHYSYEKDPNNTQNPVFSFLLSATQTGYKRNDSGGYLSKSLPPLEFEYSSVLNPEQLMQQPIRTLDDESLENLPKGLDGSSYQWIDLDGEGLSGILTEQTDGWFYKRNISANHQTTDPDTKTDYTSARFSGLEQVTAKPNISLAGGQAQFLDLAGDGQADLAIMEGPVLGFYERTFDEAWEPFRAFSLWPNIDTRNFNLKFIDLTGDGHADILISEDQAFVWYESLAEAGFAPAQRLQQVFDEEKGPRLIFADQTQSVYLADLSGDGLTDLVRIRNGEVCYWPNLGYCHFGSKVTMDNPPWFDHADLFDQRRIRLADIDGSGLTDILYLHGDGVSIYYNQSGNSWSLPLLLSDVPTTDNVKSITVVDLLGNGTACLVWSSPLPGDARSPMHYLDLMGGLKPHLLIKSVNNLGAETRIQYAPSTKFYLQDKQEGKPWITKLPFPVHVVERVETFDHISKNRFATRYAYHHGYFDGEEREFRGFGMVEQWDTEQLAALTHSDVLPIGDNIAADSYVPPIYTKTWFHTGVYLGRDRISSFFAGLLDGSDVGEYYPKTRSGDVVADAEAKELLLDDTILPLGLSSEDEREACRSLKGAMLRQEVYALDGTPKQDHPYTVTEQNFTIKRVQPRTDNPHGVFFTHPREAISLHYERNPVDPRIQHAFTLTVDSFGNVIKSASIAYGRTIEPPDTALQPEDRHKQRLIHIMCTENDVTNPIDQPDNYRTPLPAQARTYELRKAQQETSANGPLRPFRFEDVANYVNQAGNDAHDIPYEDSEFTQAQLTVANFPGESNAYFRRLIEQVRTLYRKDDLSGLLPLMELGLQALPGESYKLAFTPGLLDQVFQRPLANQNVEALLPDLSAVLSGQGEKNGGYLSSQTLKADGRFPNTDPDGHWWIPSGQSFFTANPNDTSATELAEARQHFFLTRRHRDPFNQHTVVGFDAYDLLMAETRDALGNRVTVAANDYRVLQPRLVSDPNRNQTEVAFDTLGMVVGTAVMGKPLPEPVEGDTLSSFVTDLTQAQLDSLLAAPRQPSADPNSSETTPIVHDLLQGATTRIIYDLNRYQRLGEPPFAATIARETHHSDLPKDDLGQPTQRSKLQISFSYSDGFGREIQKKIQAEPGPLVEGGLEANPRWVVSGWTIFNNKGKPVRQYEPFFDGTHAFKFAAIRGVSPVLFYDPAERVIATLHPNNTYEKVVFDPWQQTTYDVNDTCAARNSQTGDPRTDPDISGYVAEYFKTQPPTWQTWHQQRVNGTHQNERIAALRAAAHADTPTTAHFDALGRPFLTVAHNRVVCSGHDLDGTEEQFATRVELDIEGNQRAVLDERRLPVNHLPTGAIEQRIVMRYAYDMLGNRIHQLSMEAGARWMLNDVAGKPIRAWDSRGHNFTTSYDALRRPVTQTVRGTITSGEAASDPRTLGRDFVVDKIEYGEGQANAETLNLLTRIYRHFDSAGVTINVGNNPNTTQPEAYDFKGNLLRSTRRLSRDYTAIPDWLLPEEPQLDSEFFEASTRYDALNRPIQSVAPHTSLGYTQHPNKINVIQPVFSEANLLERVDVWLERATEPATRLDPADTPPSPVGVANIDYDAKGQRQRIAYKNGASTRYSYDPLTFRLTQLITRRAPASFPGDVPQQPDPNWPGSQVQNLHYTYDPAGNITHIQDDAQQAVYFRNQRVEPSNDYSYDALYRLIQASGREHLGQGGAPTAHSYNDAGRTRILSANPAGQFAPNDGAAMGSYIERYIYDAVGNFLQMQHARTDAATPSWTRRYHYSEASLNEPAKISNRLSSTAVGTQAHEIYRHDIHGNMLNMPQLAEIQWDYKDQLRLTRRQRVNTSDLDGNDHHAERTFYVYDAAGQRIRKVCEKALGLTEERIYLGGFEIFRRHSGPIGNNSATLERETLHVMDDKQRIALVEMRTFGNEPEIPQRLIRYQFGNHLGSASLELDEQARIISYEQYAPYGSSTYQAVRSRTETAKQYRYTGKERDEESGLYYHGARYYAAWIGRWASCDKAGLVDGPNIFTYCNDNPIRLYDPSGNNGEQMELVESIKVETVALRGKEPAFNNVIKKYFRNTEHSWGLNPRDYVMGHSEDTPHVLSPAGATQVVSPQTETSNIAQSVKERAMGQAVESRNAQLRKEGKEGPLEFKRNDRIDQSAKPRMDHNTRLSDVVRQNVKNYSISAADNVKANYMSQKDLAIKALAPSTEIVPVSPLSAPSEQLSFDFDKSAPAKSAGDTATVRSNLGSKLMSGVGVGVTLVLSAQLDSPAFIGTQGNIELSSSAFSPTDPHFMEVAEGEFNYFSDSGQRPSYMDSNRESPEVPIAVGSGIGMGLGGPLGAFGGALLGSFVLPVVKTVEEGFQAFFGSRLKGGTAFPHVVMFTR